MTAARPIRAAVVGYGVMGAAHAAALAAHPRYRLVAAVDPTKERRSACATRLGIPVFEHLERLLADIPLDLVAVCSPPRFHVEHLRTAVTARCHVLCEKPVAMNSAEGAAVAAAATAGGVCVYPAHNYKFSAVARLLQSPAIGALRQGLVHIVRPRHALGTAAFRPDWRREPELAGGGILTDHGVHHLYLAAHVAATRIDMVSCVGGRLIPSRGTEVRDTEVEDTAVVRMRLGEVLWNVTLSWRGAVRETTYAAFGTTGYVEIDDRGAAVRVNGAMSSSDTNSRSSTSRHEDLFPPMLDNLADALETPTRWAALLDEALDCALALERCYESMALGGMWVPTVLGDRTHSGTSA